MKNGLKFKNKIWKKEKPNDQSFSVWSKRRVVWPVCTVVQWLKQTACRSHDLDDLSFGLDGNDMSFSTFRTTCRPHTLETDSHLTKTTSFWTCKTTSFWMKPAAPAGYFQPSSSFLFHLFWTNKPLSLLLSLIRHSLSRLSLLAVDQQRRRR